MSQTIRQLSKDLRAAVEVGDEGEVSSVTGDLIMKVKARKSPISPTQAVKWMYALRNGRFFADLTALGDAVIQAGVEDPTIRRVYAQGLIDSGNLTASKYLLNDLSKSLRKNHREYAETRGLLGRIHKQTFINLGSGKSTAAKNALKESIKAYYGLYKAEPAGNLWHGINAVALLARAKRDKVSVTGFPKVKTIARDILQQIQDKKEPGVWDIAIAAEANLALKKPKVALDWCRRLVEEEGVTAFHIGSFERQLREIWGLTSTSPPGSFLLPALQFAALHRDGGQVDVDELESIPEATRADRDSELERAFGDIGPKNIEWLDQLKQCGGAVVKIGLSMHKGAGTGFVVRGADLHDKWTGESVLLTNHHVISPDGSGMGIPWRSAVVRFEGMGPDAGRKKYGVKEVLWSSPPGKIGSPSTDYLDVVIAVLDEPVDLDYYQVGKRLPLLAEKHQEPDDSQQRVYVIGHPNGGGLAFSIQDNHLLDYQDPLIHYHTPTEPGSSGSPIFNEDLELIGIHHAGSARTPLLNGRKDPATDDTYAANEGMWIQSIRNTLKTALG